MTDNEEMRLASAIGDVCDVWLAVYDRLTKAGRVTDEAARVRAANGIMVALERMGVLRAPPADMAAGFTSADKVPTTKAPAAETLDGMPPAFDGATKRWRYCPDCHTTEIDQVSTRTGGAYQACKHCHQLLQKDGAKKAMTQGGR